MIYIRALILYIESLIQVFLALLILPDFNTIYPVTACSDDDFIFKDSG